MRGLVSLLNDIHGCFRAQAKGGLMTWRGCPAGQGNTGLLPAADPDSEALRCAGNAPLREGTLGVQRSSAAVLGTKAEKKQQALPTITTKRVVPAGMPQSPTHGRRSLLCGILPLMSCPILRLSDCM